MTIKNNPVFELSLKDIEQAIKEYVDSRIDYALDFNQSKVEFKLKDVNVDDDVRGPYRPIYKLDTAELKASYLM